MAYCYGLVEDDRVPADQLTLCQNISRVASERLGLPGVVEVWPMARTLAPGPVHLFESEEEVPCMINAANGCLTVDVEGAATERDLALEVARAVFGIAESLNHQPCNQALGFEFATKIVSELGL